MNRVGNLLTDIASVNNLYIAYYKAVRTKRLKPEARLYAQYFHSNIKALQTQLLSGTIEVGNYHYFKIYDPKERQICAASFPERVLHHALMNVCHPYFERQLIFDTYATRPDKGTHAALRRAQQFVKQYTWVAKLDVRKYFDSISHTVLKQELQLIFKDYNLLSIFDSIIDTYQTSPNCGIPIGNLTSQYFANYYLSRQADHYALETLKVPAYIRYMDDILLFHNNKAELTNMVDELISNVNTRLKLQFKPSYFNLTRKGVRFLGYTLFPETLKLTRQSKKRFKTKLFRYHENFERGSWTESQYQRHLLPLFDFVMYADSVNFRKKLILALEGQES